MPAIRCVKMPKFQKKITSEPKNFTKKENGVKKRNRREKDLDYKRNKLKNV